MWGILPTGLYKLIRKENTVGIAPFKDVQPGVHELVSPDWETTKAVAISFQSGAATGAGANQDKQGQN